MVFQSPEECYNEILGSSTDQNGVEIMAKVFRTGLKLVQKCSTMDKPAKTEFIRARYRSMKNATVKLIAEIFFKCLKGKNVRLLSVVDISKTLHSLVIKILSLSSSL